MVVKSSAMFFRNLSCASQLHKTFTVRDCEVPAVTLSTEQEATENPINKIK